MDPGLAATEARSASRTDVAAMSLHDWLLVIDAIHEAIIAADAANVIVYANRSAATLLGWEPDALIGQPLTTIIPARFRARHVEAFERFASGGAATLMGRPLRLPALRGDGTETHVELLLSSAQLPTGPLMLGLLRDLSQRIELEGPGELPDLLVAALAESATIDEAVPRVLAAVGESLGWDVVQLWLYDEADAVLRRRSWWALDVEAVGAFVHCGVNEFPPGVGLPGRVWEQRTTLSIKEIATDPNFPRAKAAAAAGLNGGLAFPITTPHRVLGVVELFSSEERATGADILRRLITLGGELGLFIERRTGEEERLALLDSERAAHERAQRARDRVAYLSTASAALAESFDLQATLEQVVALAVPILGDWCVIHLVENDAVRVAAVAHADPAKIEMLRALHERYPTDLRATGGVGAAIRTGEVARHGQVDDNVLAAIARDDEHLTLLRDLAFGSVVTIPMLARDRPLGALTVAGRSGSPVSDDLVAVTEELARRAAVAIDKAFLHDSLRFQQALLVTQSEAGVDGQLVVSPNGEMVSHNRRFAEMWAMPTSVIDGGSDDDALATAAAQVRDPDAFIARVRAAYASREATEDQLIMRDGRTFERHGAPLFADDAYLGYAWYFRDVTAHKRAELRLAEEAARAADLARTLQASLLPPTLPDVAGLEVAARYHPAGHGIDVGGDFYDLFRTGRGTWSVVIGDVCGHGPEAATVTALARYTVRAAAIRTRSPARALSRLNDAMIRHAAEGGPDRFATAALGRIRVGKQNVAVTIACAGHPLPLLRRANGQVESVGQPGTLLGIYKSVDIVDHESVLAPGDALVFVTDGVLEARNGADQFGEERLAELLATTAGESPDVIAERILAAVLAHLADESRDDIAIMVLSASP